MYLQLWPFINTIIKPQANIRKYYSGLRTTKIARRGSKLSKTKDVAGFLNVLATNITGIFSTKLKRSPYFFR
jgi:hypothetical protein